MTIYNTQLKAEENNETLLEYNERNFKYIIEENKRLISDNKQKQDKIDELLKEVKEQKTLIKNQSQQIEDLLIKSDVQSNTLHSMRSWCQITLTV